MEKKHKLRGKAAVILLTVLGILLLCYISGVIFYQLNLGIVSNSAVDKEVAISKGTSSKQIAKILKEKNLIKNELAFLMYLKLNNVHDLKFGTYLLAENMGVKTIVEYLQNGSDYNPDEVTITFQEGIHMRDIATIIERNTDNSYDDVLEKASDIEYINSLKEKYWFITDEILNDGLYYKLEGYLYPNTYQLKDRTVSVEYIFEKMLDEMAKQLEDYKDYDYTKLSLHKRLALASMVEKESPVKTDRAKMASVFLNRMNKNMNLGSDVTARYANKIDDKKKALSTAQFEMKSPYNTRLSDGSMNGQLPIGPISTISNTSLAAAFYPEESPYLYFISNIQTGETFFYENYQDFLVKKDELQEVNQGF